jgi:myo-inositol 2-dehydrogenase/D-chiro-inositol 1-dehydrogenase
VFGLGRIGTIHLEKLVTNPLVDLKYAVEGNGERSNYVSLIFRLGDRGVKILTPNQSSIVYGDKDIDAVLVCTPTQQHEEIVIKALEAGKHVFCEKPLAKGHDAIVRCYELAKAKNKQILCAFNRRFDPSYSQIRDRVLAGEVGQIQVIKTTSRDSPTPSIEYLKTSGGIYQDCAVHDIDLVCWTLGEWPVEITSQASTFKPDIKAIDDFDTVAITLRFPSGVLALIDLSREAVYGYDIRLEVFGSKGMLASNERRSTTVARSDIQGSNQTPINFSFASRFSEGYKFELEHFIDSLKRGTDVSVTAEQTLGVCRIADACNQAARTGEVIKLSWTQ